MEKILGYKPRITSSLELEDDDNAIHWFNSIQFHMFIIQKLQASIEFIDWYITQTRSNIIKINIYNEEYK